MNDTNDKKYIIIGSGIAGISGAEEIRKRDENAIITVFTRDARPLYTRIRLPEYLSGAISLDKLNLHSQQWYLDRKIQVRTDCPVLSIDKDNKNIVLDNGEKVQYDSLLIATGANNFIPPFPGTHLDSVHSIRTIEDTDALRRHANDQSKIIVIGGGLLGLEMASALAKSGAEITVIEFSDRLLPRQLDQDGASLLREKLESMGLKFKLSTKVKAIEGDGTVSAISFENGEIIDADAVLISAGIRPELTLAKNCGVKTDKGIVVSQFMETTVPGIFAAGDCVEFQERLFGIWPAAEAQGKIAGAAMAGEKMAYVPAPNSNALKVSGIELLSGGEIDIENKFNCEIDKRDGIYRKFVLNDQGQLIGAILIGDLSGRTKILKALAEKSVWNKGNG